MIRLLLVWFVFMLTLHAFAVLIVWAIWRKLPKVNQILWLFLAQWIAIFLLLAWHTRANAADLPAVTADVIAMSQPQAVAHKALAGEFGELEWWQRKGYEEIAAGAEAKRYTAWVTCYSHTDPGCNRTTASGMPVSMRVAAMLDQPWGTFVLIHLPGGFELRQVYDTGSRKNRHRAQHPPRDKRGRLVRQPADVWLDRYLPHRSLRSWVVPIFVF